MAKKIDTKETTVTETPKTEMNSVALSIVKTGEKLYAVAGIKFNPETKETAEMEILTDSTDLFETQHRFKVLVVKLNVMNRPS